MFLKRKLSYRSEKIIEENIERITNILPEKKYQKFVNRVFESQLIASKTHKLRFTI